MDIRIDEAFLVQLLRTMEIYRTIMQPADAKPANQMYAAHKCSMYVRL